MDGEVDRTHTATAPARRRDERCGGGVPDGVRATLADSRDVCEGPVVRGDLDVIRDRVAEIFRSGASKPLLAPHEDSRSRDLLEAVALLEEHWPTRRRALVTRIAEL